MRSAIEWWRRWRTEGYRSLWTRVYTRDGLLARYEKLVASQPRVIARARKAEHTRIVERLRAHASDKSAPGLWTHEAMIDYLSSDD